MPASTPQPALTNREVGLRGTLSGMPRFVVILGLSSPPDSIWARMPPGNASRHVQMTIFTKMRFILLLPWISAAVESLRILDPSVYRSGQVAADEAHSASCGTIRASVGHSSATPR